MKFSADEVSYNIINKRNIVYLDSDKKLVLSILICRFYKRPNEYVKFQERIDNLKLLLDYFEEDECFEECCVIRDRIKELQICKKTNKQ